MHEANLEFWRQTRGAYPAYFTGRRVLEVGSADVAGGSVRGFFTDCEYIGVDWREADGVDVVTLAHDMYFDEPFDVVISASMLEHDPHWALSLGAMVKYLKPDGILLLSWGAAENAPHYLDTAPDGLFHALRAGLVLKELQTLGMYIERFIYEADIHPRGTFGEVALVAFHSSEYSQYAQHVSEIRPADVA